MGLVSGTQGSPKPGTHTLYNTTLALLVRRRHHCRYNTSINAMLDDMRTMPFVEKAWQCPQPPSHNEALMRSGASGDMRSWKGAVFRSLGVVSGAHRPSPFHFQPFKLSIEPNP